MSLVNVIEVSAESFSGYDDAARQAVKRAARTIQNFSAVWGCVARIRGAGALTPTPFGVR